MTEPAFHRGNVTGRPVITGTEQEASLVICIPDQVFKEATGWNDRQVRGVLCPVKHRGSGAGRIQMIQGCNLGR